jgi:hypothetical protein
MPRYVHVRIVYVSLLAACTPSLATLNAENERAVAHAESVAAASGTAFKPANVDVADPVPPPADREAHLWQPPRPPSGPPATLVAQAGSHGLLETEHVVALASNGELLFLGGVCTSRNNCGGCSSFAEYRYYHTADGHVIVVRMNPVEDVVDSQDDPSCPAGCGGGNPQSTEEAMAGAPPPSVGLDLGITSIAKLEIREDSYPVKVIERRCTNTTPLP